MPNYDEVMQCSNCGILTTDASECPKCGSEDLRVTWDSVSEAIEEREDELDGYYEDLIY